MLNFAGSKLNIDIQSLGSASKGGSYGGAASAAGSVGDAFGNLMGQSVDAGDVYSKGNNIRAEEQADAWRREVDVNTAGAQAYGNVKKTDLITDAKEDARKAMEKANKKAGVFDTIGKVAKVAIPLAMASDERMKHTIEKLDDVTLMLRELNPVSFYYKDEYTDDPNRKYYGFIAQEYKDVMPDATYTDSDSGMYKIDMNQLIALLVKGYQQLDNRVTRMEAKNVLAGVS